MVMERKILFAGTFDPFTKGHDALVQRALVMFDKVIVAVGCNMGKNCMFTIEERVGKIRELYAGDDRIEVLAYDGLTMDLVRETGAVALLRGVRSVRDFEYERDIADVNYRIGGIETVLLMSEPEYSSLSSSMVRELMNYGKDVSSLLPIKRKGL
jgi:pantetheine-phosphate adenylyltransferase